MKFRCVFRLAFPSASSLQAFTVQDFSYRFPLPFNFRLPSIESPQNEEQIPCFSFLSTRRIGYSLPSPREEVTRAPREVPRPQRAHLAASIPSVSRIPHCCPLHLVGKMSFGAHGPGTSLSKESPSGPTTPPLFGSHFSISPSADQTAQPCRECGPNVFLPCFPH